MSRNLYIVCQVHDLAVKICVKSFGLIILDQVVPKASAVVPGALNAEPIAIPADHINMTKYRSEDDGGYQKVSGNLFLMVRESSAKVQKIWQKEEIAMQRT